MPSRGKIFKEHRRDNLYANMLIIPDRGISSVVFKDMSVDEVTGSITETIEKTWIAYTRFHAIIPHKNLSEKFQVYLKGYDNGLLSESIPLQKGDIVILFMTNDIPEDFLHALEFLFSGLRYSERNC